MVVVEVGGPGGWVWSVVHYWVLRQQAPVLVLVLVCGGSVLVVGVLCLGSRRPAGGRGSLFGAGAHQCVGCAGCCLRTV